MGTEHLHPVYSRNSTVHIVTPQQGMEKHATFAAAMAQSGFIQHLLGHWEASKDTSQATAHHLDGPPTQH